MTEVSLCDYTVIRKAFICIHCECVYPDEPVTQCDCIKGTGHDFIEGKIEYIMQYKLKVNDDE